MIIDDKILKTNPLAEGGEGIIYEYNNKILKIYKDNVNKNQKLDKIKLLMNKNLPNNIIKPLDIAYNSRKQFIGYIMDKVEGEEFKRLTNKKFIKMNNLTTKYILKMLIDIRDTLEQLHNMNVFISDLNDCNILFDKNKNIYFIDIDSWSIDNIKCDVAMDSFKDPLLTKNEFNQNTDAYAFSVLMFKTLTRLHPFGGTMTPDIDILTRMKKGMSVIDNNQVKIPKTITKWSYINPNLLKEFKEIFESKKRFLINDSLNEFYNNLRHCKVHEIDYYNKFSECPLCNENAKLKTVPKKVNNNVAKGIPYILLIANDVIKTIISENSYLDINDYVVHKASNRKEKYNYGSKYYYSNDGQILYITDDSNIKIKADKEYIIKKLFKSNVVVRNNILYYVAENNNLVQLTVSDKGNYSKNISKVAFNNIFEVYDDKNYFICNIYDNMKIINISGYNYSLSNKNKIINYGIHFDVATQKWLFIMETEQGNFLTFIFDKNKLLYSDDKIRYSNDLCNITFYNNTMFIAGDKYIRGFNYEKNVYKDFPCDVINEDSKLIKNGKKFIIINEKEVYEVG